MTRANAELLDSDDRNYTRAERNAGASGVMNLYSVCLNTAEDARPDDFWIEYYWADDQDHAEMQAEDANESCAIVTAAVVPSPHGGFFYWNGEGEVQVR